MDERPPTWWMQAESEIRQLLSPSNVGLIVGRRSDAEDVLRAIGSSLGEPPRSVSEAGLAGTPASTPVELTERLALAIHACEARGGVVAMR